MTKPVLEEGKDTGLRRIAFVMPSQYTLSTLPKPNNPEIQFREVPAMKVAVLRFSWYATASRVEAQKADLIKRLTADGYKMMSAPRYAGYNPPFTAPFMMRNEILVEVE